MYLTQLARSQDLSVFLASFGEDLVGIRVLLPQFLAFALHSNGDLLPVSFGIFDAVRRARLHDANEGRTIRLAKPRRYFRIVGFKDGSRGFLGFTLLCSLPVLLCALVGQPTLIFLLRFDSPALT